MLLVKSDTNTTVEYIDKLVTQLRVREPKKLEYARNLIDECLDLSSLDALIK